MSKTSDRHEAFYQEFIALLNKHLEKNSAAEILAVASNCVGKLIAMQDQANMTPERAMQIVFANIEEGNQQSVNELLSMPTEGSA